MKYLPYISFVLFLISCSPETEVEMPELNWTKENSTKMGKEIAVQEQIDIKLFLELHQDWDMLKTGSGLMYEIYKSGESDTTIHPKENDIAEIQYTVSLLDGTECYSVTGNQYEEFVVDNSDMETGVQELIKKMSPDDHARGIIPSHLGHGLMGDMDKIPPLNTLVMDIHLIRLIKR